VSYVRESRLPPTPPTPSTHPSTTPLHRAHAYLVVTYYAFSSDQRKALTVSTNFFAFSSGVVAC
jgi:hypothetical protein